MQPNENRPSLPTPSRVPVYIDEGYSMTRTEAPKDFVGRGELNLARTTPELPNHRVSKPVRTRRWNVGVCTVRPGNLAPDDADLGSPDLLLGTVDVGDLLAEVEAAT